ncbi:MAG: V-type ATPase 116kDa subunit family protein [Candidatus Omnitrophota bacterium]
MIAPMEKVTILIFHKIKDDFLSALQTLGLLHVSQEKKDADQHLKLMQSEIMRCEAFLKTVKKTKDIAAEDEIAAEFKPKQGFEFVELLEMLDSELSGLTDNLEKTEKEIRNLAPWGEFDRKAIERLNLSGVKLRFFISPLKKFSECNIDQSICAHEISRDKTYVYFVVFEKDQEIELDCDEFFYPAVDLQTLEKEAVSLRKQIAEKNRSRLTALAAYNQVQDYSNQQKTQLNYLLVSNSLTHAAQEKVIIINGWLPRQQKPDVEEFLDAQEVYFYFSQPELGEDVPVLLKNNWFSSLFEPITKMFALPQYTEMDLTAFFAPFFTLFFGFCLGDAGYGLIILLLCAGFWRKVSLEQRPFLTLGAVFGLSTFIFGLISGNLFGIELVKIEFIRKLVLLNQDQLFYLSLKIGIVQIFFGLFLKAINKTRQFGFMSSLSTWGWMLMLTGVLPLVLAFLANSIAPIWADYSALAGLVLILLFNDLKANLFVRLGKGLWELYGGLTGFLGDVLSYVRLFALGISGAILGLVVNEIGMQFRTIPYIGYFLTFAFLIVGHTANLLLSGLSSFVHPLRLTFVEFYKNAGFEGGGRAYIPFKNVK